MTGKQNRNCLVQVRLTADERARVRTLMDNAGYRSVSCFMRDLITKKRFPDHRKEDAVDTAILRVKVNTLIYQVNKIGVNYNQLVAAVHREAGRARPDGSPWLNTRTLDRTMTELMRMTEALRDEFAVVLEVARRYLEETNQPI